MVFVFVGVVLSVLGLIHYYLWRKLVRATTRPGRARRIGTSVLVGLVVLLFAAVFGSQSLPPRFSRLLAWPGYIWLALMFYLIVGLVLVELPSLVGRVLIRRRERAAAPAAMPTLALAGVTAGGTGPGDMGGDGGGGDGGGGDGGGGDGGDRGGGDRGGGIGGDPDGESPGGAGRGEPEQLGVSRRLLLARTVAAATGAAAAGLVGSGVRSALAPPRITRVRLPVTRLSPAAGARRIALVSDIHLGPLRGAEQTRRVVELINGLDADIVAVVGDLVDGSVAELWPAVVPLQDLRSRYGAYFVTGNHEYYSGYQEWVRELPRLGLRMLRNERVELPGGLDLAGVNDLDGRSYGDGPDLAAALAGREESRAVVLLAHQPAFAGEAARLGVDLQLSGHTHGGQMVPFNLVVRAAGQPVVSGLGEVDGMPVYVTNGAGFWGPPVRVGAPADITLIELVAGH